MSRRQDGRKARSEIDLSSSGDNTVISAPSSGHIEIDHLNFLPSAGANTIILKDGSTQWVSYALDDSQGFTFDNTSGDNHIELSETSAFVMNLSAATQVSGFVLYRVVGEKS